MSRIHVKIYLEIVDNKHEKGGIAMELGIILPSYNNLLGVGRAQLAHSKVSKSKAESAKERLKQKDGNTSIANQSSERVVDVSI